MSAALGGNAARVRRLRAIYGVLDRLQGRAVVPWLDAGLARERGGRALLETYARERLREVLDHARRTVPFYAARLGALSGDADVLVGDAFEAIPPLEKADVSAAGDGLVAGRSTPAAGVTAVTSGGTTGPPTRILLDREASDAHQAAGLRSFLWWGADPTRRHAMLWGPPPDENTYGFLSGRVKGFLLRRVLLETYGYDDARARAHFEALRGRRFEFVVGYASALVRVAWQARDGEQLRARAGVVPAAEPIFGFQRPRLERVFGAPVRERYGCNEFSLIAHACTRDRLHVATDRVRVELVDEQGKAVPPGRIGEVLVTDLDNRVMPLVRYRIGDLAEWGPDCDCGLPYPTLARVHGRRRDLLHASDGSPLSPHAFAVALEGTAARGFQIVVDAARRVVEVRVEAAPFALDAARARWSELAGGEVAVRFVTDVARSRSGKILPVVGRDE